SGRPGIDYSALGCAVLLDRESGLGPLGGIERALETTQASLMLVLALDLPKMTSCFLRKLAKRCSSVAGVIPKVRGQLESLAAFYPKRCHLIARDCLLKGHRAARDFAGVCLREDAVRSFDVPSAHWGCFDNWYT